jgi:hypothetical protein
MPEKGRKKKAGKRGERKGNPLVWDRRKQRGDGGLPDRTLAAIKPVKPALRPIPALRRPLGQGASLHLLRFLPVWPRNNPNSSGLTQGVTGQGHIGRLGLYQTNSTWVAVVTSGRVRAGLPGPPWPGNKAKDSRPPGFCCYNSLNNNIIG